MQTGLTEAGLGPETFQGQTYLCELSVILTQRAVQTPRAGFAILRFCDIIP